MAWNWIELVIGAWLIVSPWLLGVANVTFAKWSSVLLGIVLVVVALSKLFGASRTAATGGEMKK